MYVVIQRCTLTSWAWALDAEAYEGGHDWSVSGSFPDRKTEDLPERWPHSIAQFRCLKCLKLA